MNDATKLAKNMLSHWRGDDGIVVALDSLALIEVSGDDAQEFLQGQFSNDIDAVAAIDDAGNAPAAGCQLNAYCNPKGRALAVIRVMRYWNGWLLLVPAALAESLIKRLRMFVLRAKVSIEQRPWVLWSFIDAPVLTRVAEDNESVACVAVDGVVPRRLIFGEFPPMGAFARIDALPLQLTDAPWRLADILSGVAQIYPQTAEQFIPQFLNLDRAGGLSFSKGCYPGQEIVARLRYRGRVKQRMVAARARGIDALAPGDPLYAGDSDNKIGTVVDALRIGDADGRGGAEYLFSATAPSPLGDQPLRVGPLPGHPATRIALPSDADADAAAEE